MIGEQFSEINKALYRKGGMIMSPQIIRIAKFVVGIVSLGLTFVGKQNSDKILDEKIAKKVAEELSKRNM